MNNYGIEDHTIEHYRLYPQQVIDMIPKMEEKIKDKKLRHERKHNVLILRRWEYIAYRLGLKLGRREDLELREEFVFR